MSQEAYPGKRFQTQVKARSRSGGESDFPWMDGLFLALAIWGSWMVIQSDMASIVPAVLAIVGFLLVRFVLHRPFHEGFAVYLALVAFNYWYFYCAAFTGRNPGDHVTWGIPATPMEKVQKDIFYFLLLGLAVIKLFKGAMEGAPFWARRLNHPLLKLIFVFGAFTVMHAIFWIIEGEGLFNILLYVRTNIEFALIPLLMCTSLLVSEKHLNLLFKGMFYTLPVVALLGIVEFFLSGSIYERTFYGGQLFHRAVSTMQNPNNLGAYLGSVLGIHILFYLYGQLSRFERWWFWPSLALSLACLFMTISRSSTMAFFIMLTLCFAIFIVSTRKDWARNQAKNGWRLVWMYGLLMAGSFIILYKFFDFKHAIVDAVELYVDSRTAVSQNRLYAPVISLGVLLNNPINALFGYTPTDYGGSDNSFANVLIQNGIIGFMLYISILLRGMMEGLIGAIRGQAHRAHFYMAAFYLIGYQVLHGFSSPINKNFPHNLYFWFMIGILVWLGSRPIKAEKPIPDVRQDNPNQSAISEV